MTLPQREKEQAHDYRYFPEPDIPPMRFTKELIEDIRRKIPELPKDLKERLMKNYRLNDSVAEILTQTKELADFFEKVVAMSQIAPLTIANVLVNQSMDIQNVKPEEFVDLITKKREEKYIDAGSIETAMNAVMRTNTKAIEDYKKGKLSAMMFLIGMVKRELAGKGDAEKIKKLLEKRIQ